MSENCGRYPVRKTSGLFGASSGSYYQWAHNGLSCRRQAADAELVRLTGEIQARHLRRYGSPQVQKNRAAGTASGPARKKRPV